MNGQQNASPYFPNGRSFAIHLRTYATKGVFSNKVKITFARYVYEYEDPACVPRTISTLKDRRLSRV
ncbi:MAG: hypothetical protein F4X05_05750 [Rhodothermaceae bacterium]|nr:hypothetical protein [Rhodothermaceae bacterium]